MIQASEMPGCCAVDVLHNFGWTNCTYGDRHHRSKDEIRSDLQFNKRNMEGGFLLAALNKQQKKELSSILVEEGFRPFAVGPNPQHAGSVVTLYVYAKK